MSNEMPLTPEQRALLAVRRMKAKLEALESEKTEPIAIVGLACRFPGQANQPEAFWHLLHTGQDAITRANPARWNIDAYYKQDPQLPGRIATQWNGFIEHVDQFDASFFGISPREASYMDPQQRLLLEVSWEALERAGQTREALAGSQTGVFIGIGNSDYYHLQTADPASIDPYVATGSAYSIAAGRISYLLDLHGPSIAIDTACSSSLVTVHQACQSLRARECNMALAGGVNLILSPLPTIAFAKWGMLASDGRCKTFDAQADGFVRGEGCGVVVLKRLSDAQADNDNILALICGSAVNQDGHSNGLTAPNTVAQQAVIQQALKNAKVEPAQISYIETHGTGTPLGDPIEVEALATVLGKPRSNGLPCVIGSVKTNIGHLETAAGIASLIKVVLSLQHQVIPPHLHFQQLNANISLDGTSLTIPTQAIAWPAGDTPRYAGISSFGFSGTNAHLVISDAFHLKTDIVPKLHEKDVYLLPFSARTVPALRMYAMAYQDFLRAPSISLDTICSTISRRRNHYEQRLAVSGHTAAELVERIQNWLEHEGQQKMENDEHRGGEHKLAFVFSGQGSQWLGMGRDLFKQEPVFREMITQCDTLLKPFVGWSLVEELYAEASASRLQETEIAQPVLFSLQVALAALWRSLGIVPDVVLGHSVGELAAAYVAGALSLSDALYLVAQRGRVMQTTHGQGRMLVVGLPERDALQLLQPYGDDVAIAAVNGPRTVVLAGKSWIIDAIVEQIKAINVFYRMLDVPYAFHSAQMDSCRQAFLADTTPIAQQTLQIPFISTVIGRPVTANELDRAYWGRNLRETVRFAAAVEAVAEQGCDLFVEIGPHPVLTTSLVQTLEVRARTYHVYASLRRTEDAQTTLLRTLGSLYMQGKNVQWQQLYPSVIPCADLPTYPWQHEHFWLEELMQRAQQPWQRQFELKLPSSQSVGSLEDVNQWLYHLEWTSALRDNTPSPVTGGEKSWLIFADEGGIGQRLQYMLEKQGATCVQVRVGEGYQHSDEYTYLINPDNVADYERLYLDTCAHSSSREWKIVHLWSLDYTDTVADEWCSTSFQQAVEQGCGSILSLVQVAVLHLQTRVPQLWLVTSGVQDVDAVHGRGLHIAQSPVWGLGKVLSYEHPEFRPHCVDLSCQPEEEVTTLLHELTSQQEEPQIALRGQRRYVARLQHYPSPSPGMAEKLHIHSEGTYVISGGLGGIGLQVARWLVEQGCRSLVLIGRRRATAEAVQMIEHMEQRGTRVVIANIDVTLKQALADKLTQITAQMPPIRGIIHAAAVLDDGILVKQDARRFWRVMAPKVIGASNLYALTQNCELDFFLLFSSVASLLGAPGQSNYAAANQCLDTLAAAWRHEGCPVISVNWGPWEQVGLAAQSGQQDQLAKRGLTSIPVSQGLAALSYLLQVTEAQLAVMRLDVQAWLHMYPHTASTALLSTLGKAFPSSQQSTLREQLLSASSEARVDMLVTALCSWIAEVIQLPITRIEQTTLFVDIGFDSLLMLELRNRLEEQLHINLPATIVWEHPTISSLAIYLSTLFNRLPEESCQAGITQQSPLCILQTGDSATTPLFCVHPLMGSALGYRDLVHYLSDSIPFYGIQAPGLYSLHTRYQRLEDIAMEYLSAVRQVQTHGPYILGGWSMGGVIAFEMALQLQRQHESTAFLALFDSYAPGSYRNVQSEKSLLFFLRSLLELSGETISGEDELLRLDEQEHVRWIEALLSRNSGFWLRDTLPQAFMQNILQLWRNNAQILAAYRPADVYTGQLTLFSPTDTRSEALRMSLHDHSSLLEDWRPFVRNPPILHSVPGNHHSMFHEPHVQQLAKKLQRCLDDASEQV